MTLRPANSSPEIWRPQTIPEVPDKFIGVGANIAYALFLLFMATVEYHFFFVPWLDMLQSSLYLRP